MEIIYQIDHELFYLINTKLGNSFLDSFFIFIRNKYVWLPLYMFIISFLIFNFKKKGILILAFAFLSVGISDFTSSSIIKPAIERLRPCNDTISNPDIKIKVDCGKGYSFPSSHAANHFALGIFFFSIFSFFNKRIAFLFILWASLIAIAQVYVGVHYPIDIIGGSILGTFTGLLCYKLYRVIEKRLFVN